MALTAVHGIVIQETNYSESSKILNVITKEYGKIGILSKGCRSIKSRLRSVSTKMTYGLFQIQYKENGLSILSAVDVLKSFNNIMSDIGRISYAAYLMDLTDQVLKQTDSLELFDMLIASLSKIDEGMDPAIITCIMELKLLDDLGIRPNIDCCSICGSTKSIITIDAGVGGYVCKGCYTNQKIYSEKLVKLIRMLYYVDINKITKLDISVDVREQLQEFILNYYEQYTGLYLKSKQFLNNLHKLGI
ncbi:MAG: DNA repair protein RecO [Bacilli bacterium]